MRRDQLDGLVVFAAVAEERGFSAAAVRLGISPSAVSQSIRQLEQRLGFTLFNRTTRSVGLTEAGARYYERVLPALRELLAASEELREAAERPIGLLRLNVPRSLDRHPDIDLEIVIENALTDIVARGFDAGIRFGDLVDRDMVGVNIGPPIAVAVLAAPEYLARRGTPLHPRDLAGHACIGFRHVTTGQVERWAFEKEGERMKLAVRPRLLVNDSTALVQAALDGIGIAYMISGYIEPFVEQGRLVRILEAWSPALPNLQLYYPDRRRVPAKLRALIDFLRAERVEAGRATEAMLR